MEHKAMEHKAILSVEFDYGVAFDIHSAEISIQVAETEPNFTMEYKAILPVELDDGVLFNIQYAEICIKVAETETNATMCISAITNTGHVYEEILGDVDLGEEVDEKAINTIRNCISNNSLKLRCILDTHLTASYACLALYDGDEHILSCGYYADTYENVDNDLHSNIHITHKLSKEQYKSIIQYYFDTQVNTGFK